MSKIESGIGYSPLTDKVYMGRQNATKGMWVGDKKDITNQFIATAFAYFEENTIRKIETKGKGENLFINIKKDQESLLRLAKKVKALIESLK